MSNAKISPLSDLERFDLLQAMFPGELSDDNDGWDAMEDLVYDKFNIDAEDFDLLAGHLVMCAPVLGSPLTGTQHHVLGTISISNGQQHVMAAVKREASNQQDERNEQPMGVNPTTMLALLDRLGAAEHQLSRYSMCAGHADQRRAESRACREALGFEPDSEHVSPSDLREAINKLASEPDLRPGLSWAIERCKALQSQGFERSRNDVLIRDFQNCIDSLVKFPK